ncbi:MAG: BrnT family toxin [Pseudomonas sp.]
MHNELAIQFDPTKARSNLKKHGVHLAEAAAVLQDASALTLEDHTYDERRWVTLGDDGTGRLLVVVYTYRAPNYLRLISARKAQPLEIKQYNQG